jgi:fructokinase
LLANGKQFLKKAGGALANVAAAIATLGGKVEPAEKGGADPFGNHLVRVVQDFGLGIDLMLTRRKVFYYLQSRTWIAQSF